MRAETPSSGWISPRAVETQSGGNGLTGSDETSEDLSVTWVIAAATPGEAPAADWVINEILADPASGLAGDSNGDGVRDFSDDEFVEVVNVSGASVDISGWTLVRRLRRDPQLPRRHCDSRPVRHCRVRWWHAHWRFRQHDGASRLQRCAGPFKWRR